MRLDWYVLSTIFLSSVPVEEGQDVYHLLIFFTAGISSLYPNDDTKNDGDAVVENEDYYGLDLVLHDIELAHGKNYAMALYHSMRNSELQTARIKERDVAYALTFCSFRMALKEFLSLDDLSYQLSHDAETMTGIKLQELIGTLLGPLPGNDGQVFYFKAEEAVDIEDSDEPIDFGSLPSNDIDHSASGDQIDEDSDMPFRSEEQDEQTAENVPLFFRIYLDGKAASQQDIRAVKQRFVDVLLMCGFAKAF